MDQQQFLKLSQESSQGTYQAFKWLLSELENPSTRTLALEFWHSLFNSSLNKKAKRASSKKANFSVSNLTFQQGEAEVIHLKLLQLPSTFAPEDWSFTFFEGLARCKPGEFKDRTVTELGCGIGWISIALAKQKQPSKIYGLDINPKAILCSKLNLFLNSFDSKGEPTWHKNGLTLLDICEFHVSDLLYYCRNKNILLDRIIGCIPQVLNPDPEFASQILTRRGHEQDLEQANDEFLYSLSNYTANQGYIEDQFGLGLIARTVEESLDSLKASGKLILNLGGRPGSTVLNRLFLRRGFGVNAIWSTLVTQAKDTDIHSLVKIEEQTDHRFEFFMEKKSNTPVSAKTALAYAEAGGEIAHALTVYEAHPRDPIHLPQILHFLRQAGYEASRHSIDLSFPEDALAVEKMSFLTALIDRLKKDLYFPYEGTAGTDGFQKQLASFFTNYYQLKFNVRHLLISPNRAVLCRNLLSTFRPKKILIDSHLALFLPKNPEITEIPKNLDLVCELIKKLKPEIVIYSMPSIEAESIEPFFKLCEVSKKTGTRVFIDASDWIELSSHPRNNAIFRYLSDTSLPQHVSLICGLVKNRLYNDLEVCFLISENHNLLQILRYAAELTYSRTPTLSQLYYEKILRDLLNFHITEPYTHRKPLLRALLKEDQANKKLFIQPSSNAKRAFSHPAIRAETQAIKHKLIRLDYGENCLPSPTCLRRSIFEAFSKKQISPEETNCNPEILKLAQQRFNIGSHENLKVVLSNGIAPLFSEIAHHCAQNSKTLVFPAGSYGHFVASAEFHGAKVKIIPTNEQENFKLTPENLSQTLDQSGSSSWVVLTAPIVNPTGALYTPKELAALFDVVDKKGSLLILDTVFCGLEFSPSKLEYYANLEQFPSLRWALLGGLSKEFAAGGLRIGYAISSDMDLKSLWSQGHAHSPHDALKFTLKKVYQELFLKNPELIVELNIQRQKLRQRAKDLSKVLQSNEWTTLPCKGGLFLSAKPTKTSSHAQIEKILIQKWGVLANSPVWTGIPGYYRFVISGDQAEFEKSLARMKL